VVRGLLDCLGTGCGCRLGWGMRQTLERGRTEPRDRSRRTGGSDDGTRIEAHHDDTSTGGGRGRRLAQGKMVWIRRMIPFSQLGQR